MYIQKIFTSPYRTTTPVAYKIHDLSSVQTVGNYFTSLFFSTGERESERDIDSISIDIKPTAQHNTETHPARIYLEDKVSQRPNTMRVSVTYTLARSIPIRARLYKKKKKRKIPPEQ